MVLNKRGMFFTLLTIVIISIFIVSFAFIPSFRERKAVEDRVETLNNFVLAVEDDMPRQLYTSGYRILFIFEREIFETGSVISNLDLKADELFFYGTFEGTSDSLMNGVMFNDTVDNLNLKAGRVNANVSLGNPLFNISQDSPWHVKISLTVDVVIEDETNLVLWDRVQTFNAYVPIETFDDPLYAVDTQGKILNKFVQGNLSYFEDHALNSWYIQSDTGPSFLDRLKGVNNGGASGIESLVNLQELAQQGIPAKAGKSVVDYTYFSNSPVDGCQISGMPDWFRLDNPEHTGIYGVSCI
ncbi:MAG: hypothetical protein KJ718_04690 [Nanoarchaeota archaeon]|nr:hypothetical protein [Nanoarchaeota archaeon]MBU1051824.1 hypothetical protein [Nanoarchaeota archaeon]MBU1988058.1 hypothetical protein [Nanoarchaeota archaeon]